MNALDDTVAYLFVPGNKPERFAKALATGATPVLDLEDAVAQADKPAARHGIVSAPAELLARSIVRINARDTGEFTPDMEALKSVAVAGVMLAKAQSADDVQAVRSVLGGIAVIALIETAKGFASARQIAASGAERLAFGTVDFCADVRIRDDGVPLAAFRSELVLASALAGLSAPVDGVCTAINDEDALERHARRASAFGFGGVLCIHPRQVPVVNRVFAPTDEEVQRAKTIVSAADSQTAGVITVDGAMVDRPVVELARQTLALHARFSGVSR